jgi:acetyl esterase
MAQSPSDAAQSLIAEAEAGVQPPVDGLSVESARQRLSDLFAPQPTEPVASVENFSVPGPESDVPVRVYEPDADGPYPIVLYFHGGGWVVGDLDTHDTVCAALTNRANCLTISVDYRLAPEHPFPAGLEDCYSALEWVSEYGHRMNGDPDRLAVAGDSAGGNLAAAVSLLARDRDGPDIAHQALVYPAVASPVVHHFDSYDENGEGYLLELAGSRWYMDKYVDSPIHFRNEYFAPLLADDLSDLPPATVVTAGFDLHRDEGIAYADRLDAAGVDVSHTNYEEMIHTFVNLPEFFPESKAALEEIATRLTASFDA